MRGVVVISEPRIIGGDERRVVIEKTVERNNHHGLKVVRISIPRIPTLHGKFEEVAHV